MIFASLIPFIGPFTGDAIEQVAFNLNNSTIYFSTLQPDASQVILKRMAIWLTFVTIHKNELYLSVCLRIPSAIGRNNSRCNRSLEVNFQIENYISSDSVTKRELLKEFQRETKSEAIATNLFIKNY